MLLATIPTDVIQEILSRLAVKDLFCFRCVSKFFKSLIDSRDFRKLHACHSQNTSTNLYGIECFVRSDNSKFKIFDVNNVSEVMINQPLEQKDRWKVVGSCNGLIALRTVREDILIWNPFVGKSKKVASSVPSNSTVNYGFGYDSKNDDYKLVRIMEYRSQGEKTLKTAVYNLKTSSWKEIDKGWPSGSCPIKAAFLVNNALHWGAFGEDKKIVVFDLVKEEFHSLSVLGRFQDVDWIKLNVVDGCLAVTCRSDRHNCVWVMKEYVAEESWTEVFSYLRSELRYRDKIYPLAYSNKRDKFLLSCSCSWYWYDLFSKKFDRCYNGKSYFQTAGEVILFTGSLIAPDDYSTDVVELKRKQTVLEYNKENMEEKRRKME